MEVIIFNGKDIFTEDDFFTSLCKQAPEFGDYFGRNLDALNDYIDILSGKRIIWENFKISLTRLDKDFIRWFFHIIKNHNISVKKENEYIFVECR